MVKKLLFYVSHSLKHPKKRKRTPVYIESHLHYNSREKLYNKSTRVRFKNPPQSPNDQTRVLTRRDTFTHSCEDVPSRGPLEPCWAKTGKSDHQEFLLATYTTLTV